MTSGNGDRPESTSEEIARTATEAYAGFTEMADRFPPEQRNLMLAMRDLLTDVAATTIRHDAELAKREAQRELIDATYHLTDMAAIARALRARLTPSQLAELSSGLASPTQDDEPA